MVCFQQLLEKTSKACTCGGRGHNEWAAFQGALLQRWRGDICPADQREEDLLAWWWWRDAMCGEAGCLHCGFTSATSHPLFQTIIRSSIIHMIFTRANYTGLCPAEKHGQSVLLLHSHPGVQVCCWSCSSRGWGDLCLFLLRGLKINLIGTAKQQ